MNDFRLVRCVAIPMPREHRRLAVFGWVLYLISWITPGIDGGRSGAWAFVAAAGYGMNFLVRAGSLSGVILGLSLLFGWLANFSIFIAFSVPARLVWIAAPWFPYAAVLLLHAPVPPSHRAISLLYCYPWAIGIALIHMANIAEARREKPLT